VVDDDKIKAAVLKEESTWVELNDPSIIGQFLDSNDSK